MKDRILSVLFRCTGNSARSIMAEALLQHLGVDKFSSKSWDEFTGKDAPHLGFVFTLYGSATGEVCPVWTGQPISTHWGIEDPDRPELDDDEQRRYFEKVYQELDRRIRTFTSLPIDKLDTPSLQKELDDIGKSSPNQY